MIKIYTDGSCFPNPNGIGGWAFAIIKNDELLWEEKGKDLSKTATNNRMELTACIKALECCKKYLITKPLILSDSEILVKWSSKGKGKKNKDLIQQLIALNKDIKANFKWIKAHNGIKWNEYVDKLASYKA